MQSTISTKRLSNCPARIEIRTTIRLRMMAVVHLLRKRTSTENSGTILLDATCAPADIKYPTDLNRVNDARELSEAIIDRIREGFTDPNPRPRTKPQVCRKRYLKIVKHPKYGLPKRQRPTCPRKRVPAAKPDENGKHLKIKQVQTAFSDLVKVWNMMFPVEQYKFIRTIIAGITVFPDKVTIEYDTHGLKSAIAETEVR